MEECTRADTGVGAAIAAGSQEEKGIWALLVIAAIIIRRVIHLVSGLFSEWMINQCPEFSIKAILSKIRTSPIRLVNAVIMPAARDLGFW